MPTKLKKLVEKRMAETGEPWVVAKRNVRADEQRRSDDARAAGASNVKVATNTEKNAAPAPTNGGGVTAQFAFRAYTAAMCNHVGEGSVPIVHAKHGPIGSGTLFTIAGRYFVVTAAHVIRDVALDDIEIPVTPRATEKRALLVGMGWRGGDAADPVDVAWIEIKPATAQHMNFRFFGIDRMLPSVAHVSDLAFLMGFPSGEIEVYGPSNATERVVRSNGVGLCTFTLGADKLGPRFNQEYDTYVALPDGEHERVDTGWVKRVPESYGISGGSVWLVMHNGPPIWHQDRARMISINHSWLRGEWQRGTQVQHWLRMVAEDLPELRDEILRVFPKLEGIVAGPQPEKATKKKATADTKDKESRPA